jgi:hypothetical protein
MKLSPLNLGLNYSGRNMALAFVGYSSTSIQAIASSFLLQLICMTLGIFEGVSLFSLTTLPTAL